MRDHRWLEAYIGREFTDEFKCWTLVQEVYRDRLGIELKSYKGVDTADVADMIRAAREMKRDAALPPWTKVDGPQDYDVVLMAGHIEGARAPIHAGVLIDGKVLHVEAGKGTVFVPLAHPTIKFRIVAFCRHEKLMVKVDA